MRSRMSTYRNVHNRRPPYEVWWWKPAFSVLCFRNMIREWWIIILVIHEYRTTYFSDILECLFHSSLQWSRKNDHKKKNCIIIYATIVIMCYIVVYFIEMLYTIVGTYLPNLTYLPTQIWKINLKYIYIFKSLAVTITALLCTKIQQPTTMIKSTVRH